MKLFQILFIYVGLCVALHLHHPDQALAHGTGFRLIDDAKAIAVSFFYADGQPMRYAETLVFSPNDDDVEYQNGRTDQQGRFAFYPHQPGTWRLVVNDGMGHRAEGIVSVKNPLPKDAESDPDGGEEDPENRADFRAEAPEHSHTGLKLIAGLSLIGNLCFAGLYLKNRKAA